MTGVSATGNTLICAPGTPRSSRTINNKNSYFGTSCLPFEGKSYPNGENLVSDHLLLLS